MSGVEFLPNQAPPAEPFPPAPPISPEFADELATPQARRRRGLGPRSLTAQLITGVVTLVLIVVVATSAGTYFALKSFLYDRLGQQLNATALSASGSPCFSALAAGEPARCDLRQMIGTGQKEWIAIVSPSGTQLQLVASRNDDLKLLKLPPKLLALLVAHPGEHVDYETSGAHLRLTSADLNQGGFVVVGLSTADVENTLHQLVAKELLIGTAAVLVAFFATAGGVRFSLRRLKRVSATAQEVAAELSPTGAGLDRRVDVPDDGSEVGQLAESMNTLLSTVETQFAQRLESEARLRQFLADASHELRTPLTSIRGYAELARMQRAAGADADDNLSRIESEGTRMSRLVEDLLTLARGDQDASALPAQELVDVGELIDDAARDTRAAFPNRRVDAQPMPNLHLIGDHDQLLRAVRNLMANAAVHTAPDRPILVRCAPDGDSAVIQVIDGGPGLPPEEAAHVFERFWRADKARTRVRGGSGLGLSIVSAIVAAHGGTVRFDSSVEAGSTVTVRLPAVSV